MSLVSFVSHDDGVGSKMAYVVEDIQRSMRDWAKEN